MVHVSLASCSVTHVAPNSSEQISRSRGSVSDDTTSVETFKGLGLPQPVAVAIR